MDQVGATLATIVSVGWVLSGVIGFFLLLAKGKFKFGLVTWLLFGWWGIFIIVPLAGGLLLWAGLAAKADETCPHCREKVKWDAVKCPYCQSLLPASESLEPAGQ